MRILFVLPNTRPKVMEISGDLESMQTLVSGYIQAIYPFDEPIALICNDEGKLQNLPPNRLLRDPATGTVYDYIAGPFFLCAAPPDSENFESLTDEQIQRYSDYYKHPIMLF